MKKTILTFLVSLLCTIYGFSQDKDNGKNTINLEHRPADHFMLQLSTDFWAGMPDSIGSHQNGFSRGFNAYFMFDKPFRTAPKFSLGIGVGVSTSNIYFDNMLLDLKSGESQLRFIQADSMMHFKKYKIAATYLEIPLEFRFTAKPERYQKGFKAAIGLKIGTLVNAHTKGKTPVDKNGNTIGAYTEKLQSKRFVTKTRFTATARVGYGVFSLFGTYSLSPVFKEGVAADMNLIQVGLCISGL